MGSAFDGRSIFQKCAHLLYDSPYKPTIHSKSLVTESDVRSWLNSFIYNMIHIYIYMVTCMYVYINIYTRNYLCVYISYIIYICDCVYIYILLCVYIYIYIIVIGLHPSSFRLDAVNSTSSNYPCSFDWKTCMPGVFTVSARIVIC